MIYIKEKDNSIDTISISESGEITTKYTGEDVFIVDKKCYDIFRHFQFHLINYAREMLFPCFLTATRKADDKLNVMTIYCGKDEGVLWVKIIINGNSYLLQDVIVETC